MVKKILDLLRQLKINYIKRKILLYDVKKSMRYSSDAFYLPRYKESLEREILVLCHTIEKGLSHKQIKPLFGVNSINSILYYLNKYEQITDKDEYITCLAKETLRLYKQVNLDLGVDSAQLSFIPEYAETVISVGASDVDKKSFFAASAGSYEQVVKARHSVRLYDYCSKKIDERSLMNAINNATNSPSACNRQAVRVKIITNRQMISDICDIQKGARGFGSNAGALLIISADLRYYMALERRLPMLDCGIFIMNLVNFLYCDRYGSCILNGSLSENQEKELAKIVELPPNELIAAFILVSDIPEDAIFKVAKSEKKSVDSIVTIL